jgi:hypothetical protein
MENLYYIWLTCVVFSIKVVILYFTAVWETIARQLAKGEWKFRVEQHKSNIKLQS